MTRILRYLLPAGLLWAPLVLSAQVTYRYTPLPERPVALRNEFTVFPAVSYTKDTQLGLGVMATGLYYLDRTDATTPPSDASLFGAVSTTGFYAVGATGHTIFRHGIHRLACDVSFASRPTDYWGIGYAAGAHNARSSYVDKRVRVEAEYRYRALPHFFVGASLGFRHVEGVRFEREEYIEGQSPRATVTGLGAIVAYDTRDILPNPRRGLYLGLRAGWMPAGLGSLQRDGWQVTFTGSHYAPLWRGAVLATELYGEFNAAATPWSMLARLGGTRRMRGYYEGQYNDIHMVTFQAELRQHIWRWIGAVAWGGAGNVFPSFGAFRWDETLPNYGVGLRWEFNERLRLRLDYGFGRRTSGLIFQLNEAF